MTALLNKINDHPKTVIAIALLVVIIIILICVMFTNWYEDVLCHDDGDMCKNVENKYIVYTTDIKTGPSVVKKSLDPVRKCELKYFGLDPEPNKAKKCYARKNIWSRIYDSIIL